MRIHTYGGVNEIGGNTFLLETPQTRILLDFGRSFKYEGLYFSGFLQPRTYMGLKDFLEFGILPSIPALYARDFQPENTFQPSNIQACFISHAHIDHFGSINLLNEDIPIYMGETSKTIIQSIQDTTRKRFNRPYIKDSTDENPSNVRTFRTGDIVQVGSLEITPVHVDHSLPGAYGFILEDLKTQKKIGYSGDIRLHGWRKDLTNDFIYLARKKNLFALLMEGTNINEDLQEDENQVQKILKEEIAATEGLAIANYSLRDIDRFRSFYTAAKDNGRKLLINTKQAYLLQLLQDDINLELPSLDDPNISIYKRPKKRYYNWELPLFDKIALVESPTFDQTKYVFHCDFWNLNDLIDIQPEIKVSTFFYSHGDPFDVEGMIDYNRMLEWIKYFKLEFKQYHASGHAYQQDLKKIVEVISPEILIPIHSEYPEKYKELVDIPIILPTRKGSIKI